MLLKILAFIEAVLLALPLSAAARSMRVSYYGGGEKVNSTMADGKHFTSKDPSIAASLEYPFGTRLRLHNPANNHVHNVTVQDCGPYKGNRELDISKSAAAALDFVKKGIAKLEVEVLYQPPRPVTCFRHAAHHKRL